MLGGWTATVDYWGGEMPGNENGVLITRGVAEYSKGGSRGILTASCETGDTWGNDTMSDRISDLVDACQTDGYFPNGRVVVFGNSMGSLCALKWALTNPFRVEALLLALPAPDVQSLYDNNPLGVTSHIASAYGGSRPLDGDNPAKRTDELASVPIWLWHASNDPIALTADTLAFADAVGIPEERRFNMGAVGHTWGDYSVFNGTALAQVANLYGCGV